MIGKARRIRSHSNDADSGSSVGETRFTYDGSRNQVRRHSTEQGKTSTIIQQGGVELIIEGSERRFRRNLGNAIVERSGSAITTRYVYTDHLGSVDVITNAIGQLVEKLSFDAFGKRRAVFNQSGQSIALNLTTLLAITHQGYTGHQQVDHAGIVQMGGRIYDSHIGRFLQADPFVQSPSNSQNFNRYSYVLNNPLSYTDPSGYIFKKLKQYAAAIVGIALVYFTGGMASPFVATWYGAAAAGAIAGAVGAAVNGGSVLKGALWGAFSAAAFYGVGSAFGDVAFGSSAHMMKTAAHGLTGGVMNVLQGGKFGHGFAAAGTAQFAAPGIDKIGDGKRFSAGRITAAAVAGGTASSLSGGKFANGAVTGAFSRMFNDEMHHQHWSKVSRAAAYEIKALDNMDISTVEGRNEFKAYLKIHGWEGKINATPLNPESSQLNRMKLMLRSDFVAIAAEAQLNIARNVGSPGVDSAGSSGSAVIAAGASDMGWFGRIASRVFGPVGNYFTLRSYTNQLSTGPVTYSLNMNCAGNNCQLKSIDIRD